MFALQSTLFHPDRCALGLTADSVESGKLLLNLDWSKHSTVRLPVLVKNASCGSAAFADCRC